MIGSGVLMALIAAAVAWSLYRVHRNPNVEFNLLDLLMENGRVSKVSCLVMGSFAVTTWIMVSLTLTGRQTEGYFTIYGAVWVAPLLARMFAASTKPEGVQ